jgi:hypothetical protein
VAKDSCASAESHRKAQQKYVDKNPKAQAARVSKSASKSSTKAGTSKQGLTQSKTPGKTSSGKSTGGKTGRPRKGC